MNIIREGFILALDTGLFLLGIVLFLALVVAAGWFVREVDREWESREAARHPAQESRNHSVTTTDRKPRRKGAETRPESTP